MNCELYFLYFQIFIIFFLLNVSYLLIINIISLLLHYLFDNLIVLLIQFIICYLITYNYGVNFANEMSKLSKRRSKYDDEIEELNDHLYLIEVADDLLNALKKMDIIKIYVMYSDLLLISIHIITYRLLPKYIYTNWIFWLIIYPIVLPSTIIISCVNNN